MQTIDKVERKINALEVGTIVPFSSIAFEDVSKDTIRKYGYFCIKVVKVPYYLSKT